VFERTHRKKIRYLWRIRHSGLAERTESWGYQSLLLLNYYSVLLCFSPAQRGWNVSLHHSNPLIR
jgi:hypothetical protein